MPRDLHATQKEKGSCLVKQTNSARCKSNSRTDKIEAREDSYSQNKTPAALLPY